VTDHFHTDWYRNRAAVRQGLSILAGIFIVEGVRCGFLEGDFRVVPSDEPQIHLHTEVGILTANGESGSISKQLAGPRDLLPTAIKCCKPNQNLLRRDPGA
jgi:hypothetical protein